MVEYKGQREPFYGGCRYYCTCGQSVEIEYPPIETELSAPNHKENDRQVDQFFARHSDCPVE
jgi:hypothetical protein